eukprot:CFRG7590T1
MPRFKTTNAHGEVLKVTRFLPTRAVKTSSMNPTKAGARGPGTKKSVSELTDAIRKKKLAQRPGSSVAVNAYGGVKQYTMDFLRELTANNKPLYLKQAKVRDRYDTAMEDFTDLTVHTLSALSEVDDAVRVVNLKPKQCIYRIYNDQRFGGLPYKEYFAAIMAPSINPRKSNRSVYYLSICPGGKSILGGGMYNPAPKELKAIRDRLVEESAADELRGVLMDPNFKQTFDGGFEDNEKSALKGTPRGYSIGLANSDLIRFKSFTVKGSITDDVVTSGDILPKLRQMMSTLHPLCVALDRLAGLI